MVSNFNSIQALAREVSQLLHEYCRAEKSCLKWELLRRGGGRAIDGDGGREWLRAKSRNVFLTCYRLRHVGYTIINERQPARSVRLMSTRRPACPAQAGQPTYIGTTTSRFSPFSTTLLCLANPKQTN